MHWIPVATCWRAVWYLLCAGSLITTVQSSPAHQSRDDTDDLWSRQSGNAHETEAASPPWIEASVLVDPPPCVADNIPCKFTKTRIEDCTATKCITAFDGACMERAQRVDLACICRTLSSQNCAVCSST